MTGAWHSGGTVLDHSGFLGYLAVSGRWPVVESTRWSQDAIERQMSHQERNSVRAAYIHKAAHLEARKAMMQWWSDYLDTCREVYVPPYMWGKQGHRIRT